MSNDLIGRIRYIEVNIAKLDRLISDGECFAAGITVEIGVGANPSETLALDFGVYSDMRAILDVMRQGLVDSLRQNIKNATSECLELSKFLADRAPLAEQTVARIEGRA